ncbi:T9SS type A sorting domain-containing protein [Chryseosolibacter indicus]|uniref:T9SS type A sorting domain-containing protein n=1 Tax=Chryseosolibacter indicus TaxID=2782351 RepID=A0ABS5VNN7_9BACT|nr:T9SS type A sorting domain-containing protein [Chryseosolibacter indicus]MBT1702746.1 T9SS type A sorting domain-containing protein [Chryseosolibacter indicus]
MKFLGYLTCAFILTSTIALRAQVAPSISSTYGKTVCPGESYNYGLINIPYCTSSISWSISGGGTIVGSATGGSINVIWNHSASVGWVYCNVSVNSSIPNATFPCTYSHSLSYSVSLKIPSTTPVSPTSITFPSGNLCPDEQITLTTNSLNASHNYVWQYNINNTGWSGIGVTSSNTTTFTVPKINAFTSNYHRIKFRVYSVYSACSNIRSSSEAVSGDLFVYPPSPVITLVPKGKVCTASGGVTISGVTSYYPEFKVNIKNTDTNIPVVSNQIYTTATASNKVIDLPPGNYSFQVVNFSSSDPEVEQCFQNSQSFTVAYSNPVINITENVQHEACYNPNVGTGAISLTVSGGSNSSYSYLWSAANWTTSGTWTSNTKDISGLQGGRTFNVKVNDTNGCTGEKNIIVNEEDEIVVSAYVSSNYNDEDVSCPGAADGKITVIASGGSDSFTYSTDGSSFQSSNILTGLSAKTYNSITVKDNNNCLKVGNSVTINPAPSILPGTVAVTDLTCYNTPTGKIAVSGFSGGTKNLAYSIDGINYQSGTTFSSLYAGNYSLIVKDANSCTTAIPLIEVDQPTAITFSAIELLPQSCDGKTDGVIKFKGVGGMGLLNYSIDGINYVSGDPAVFTNLQTGNFTLSIKDTSVPNCIVTTSRTLPIQPVITGNIVENQPISCNSSKDGALNLTPGGGTAPYTFTWSNSSLNEDISDLAVGLYEVTIKDSKGCEKKFNYNLQEPDVLTLSSLIKDYHGFGVSCINESDGEIDITPHGGTGPFTYVWSDGGDLEDNSGLSPGAYRVDVNDSHGCKAFLDGLTITSPTELNLAVDRFKNISCHQGNDGEIELGISGGAGEYRFSKNNIDWQQEKIIKGLTAGVYTVYLEDANGCQKQVSKELTEPSALTLNLVDKVETICGEANGSAEVVAAGGVGNYRYEWYDGNNQLIANTAKAISLGSGDYTVVSVDGNNCTISDEISINDSNGPKITQELLQGLTCYESNDGKIGISITQGAPPYKITWDIAGEQSTQVANVTGGEHWVEVRDKDGCRDKEVYNIPYPAPLKINFNHTLPLCKGNADGQISSVVTGGNPGNYSYVWSTGSTESFLKNIHAGTYTLTVKDVRECSLAQEVKLDDPALFTIDLGGDRVICVGQKVPVSVKEEGTYKWTSDKGFTSADRNVVLSVPAIYKLEVVSPYGCFAEDQFEIRTSSDLLQADFLMAPEAFASDTVVVIDISWPVPDRIGWSFPPSVKVLNQTDIYAEVVFSAAGQYDVLLNTYLGECIDSLSKMIVIKGDAIDDAGGRVKSSSIISMFEIYPNPSSGDFNLFIDLSENAPVSVKIFNTFGGKKVFDLMLDGSSQYDYQATLKNLTSGLYFIVLETKRERVLKRLVIK